MSKLTLVAVLLGSLAISGCASEAEVGTPVAGRCSAESTSWAIGSLADEANGRKLFQQSGAGLWRLVTPDKALLKDYRDDRLNVHVDASNRITSIDCG